MHRHVFSTCESELPVSAASFLDGILERTWQAGEQNFLFWVAQVTSLQTAAISYDNKEREASPPLLLRLLRDSCEQRTGAVQIESVVLSTGDCSLDSVLSYTDRNTRRGGA